MGDIWPLPIDASPRWTPRRALMLGGGSLVGLGVLGFFVDWRAADPFYLDIEKQLMFIALGAFMWYVGEVWDSVWKRWVAGPLALVFVALGIVGLLLEPDLGFTRLNAPWESLFFLAVGVWHAICEWYPRTFYDYEWATGVSSGLRDR